MWGDGSGEPRGGPGYGHDRTAAGPADLKTLLTAGLDLVGAAL